jgi:chromosome segregation ATPase
MNIRACATVAAGVLIVVAASGTTRSLKASPQTAPAADPMSALLAEVHALRIAMERSGTVTPRVQLTLARLNIEEQRIAQLAAQLDQVRRELSATNREAQKLADQIPEIEKSLESAPDDRTRRGLELEEKDVKRRLKEQARLDQELRARENDAALALTTEQGRWVELNAHLDDLERLLTPVPR